MKKNQLILLILFGSAALILALWLAVLRPIVNTPAETEPPITTGPGEGVQYNYPLLYPSLSREQIRSIRVHNSTGDYKFERTALKEDEEATPTSPFLMYQVTEGEFRPYVDVAYNEERFAELIVATGTFY